MDAIVKPYHMIHLRPFRDALRIKEKRFADLGNAINLGVELRKFRPRNFRITPDVSFIDVPSFLERFKKQGLEDVNLSKYSIKPGSYGGEIWMDAPYGFFLHTHETIGAMGFEAHPGAILISQMQGRHGRQEELAPIRWPNALLNMGLMWAAKNDIPEVWVLPHTRNKYGTVRIDEKGAKMLYDVTAKREGFKYDKERGVYVRSTDSVIQDLKLVA